MNFPLNNKFKFALHLPSLCSTCSLSRFSSLPSFSHALIPMALFAHSLSSFTHFSHQLSVTPQRTFIVTHTDAHTVLACLLQTDSHYACICVKLCVHKRSVPRKHTSTPLVTFLSERHITCKHTLETYCMDTHMQYLCSNAPWRIPYKD